MSVTNSHQRVKGSSSVLDLCLHPVTPLVGLLYVFSFLMRSLPHCTVSKSVVVITV